jgi:rod shape-determining protein MreD
MSRFHALRSGLQVAVLLILIVVVQGILAYRFPLFRFWDLPLIYVVYYGFRTNSPSQTVLVGSVLGLMQDSLSGAGLGTNGFSKSLIGFLAASAGAKFNVDQIFTRILALFLFTAADSLIVTILGLSIGAAPGAFGGQIDGMLLSAVFNALLGLIMFGYRDRFGNATA